MIWWQNSERFCQQSVLYIQIFTYSEKNVHQLYFRNKRDKCIIVLIDFQSKFIEPMLYTKLKKIWDIQSLFLLLTYQLLKHSRNNHCNSFANHTVNFHTQQVCQKMTWVAIQTGQNDFVKSNFLFLKHLILLFSEKKVYSIKDIKQWLFER